MVSGNVTPKGHEVLPVRPTMSHEGDEEKRIEGVDGEEGEDISEEGEEGADAKVKKEVRTPSAEEVRVHRMIHIPFRSWCAECIAGRGRDDPHKQRLQ